MKNTDLKQTYDTMHQLGKRAWFDDGQAERKAILEMGQPWEGKTVLEIGCGEGDLLNMIHEAGGIPHGVDYSAEAIKELWHNYWDKVRKLYISASCRDWHDIRLSQQFDVIVMQGVMEHLDDPFAELADMIERFKPKTVITSMPGFLNTRGIIWHTLDMLGAVMSKTDLHFIDPWEVRAFADKHGYRYRRNSIDMSWGNGKKMIEDLRERIPLALIDGNIQSPASHPNMNWNIECFLSWLEKASEYFDQDEGAINIYRIDL